jgi:hypothetical protein
MALDAFAAVDVTERMPELWTPPYVGGDESISDRVIRLNQIGPKGIESSSKLAERLIQGMPRGWSPQYVSDTVGGDRVIQMLWARTMGIYLSSGTVFLKDFCASPASSVVLGMQGSMSRMLGVPSGRLSASSKSVQDLELALSILGKSVPANLKDFYTFAKFYILCDGMGLTLPFS